MANRLTLKFKQQQYFLDRPIEDYTLESTYQREGKTFLLPNNRQFPEWITKQFIEYQITQDIDITCGDDKDAENREKKLFSHQSFIRDYMAPNMPYRGILLYHDLGSGKTRTAITVAEQYRNLPQPVKILVLLPATLESTWMTELKTWGSEDIRRPADYNLLKDEQQTAIDAVLDGKIVQQYLFVHYNAPNKMEQLQKAIKEIGKTHNLNIGGKLGHTLVIIDEVHNFISMMVNKNENGPKMYKMLMDVVDCKFLFLSATPVLNTAFELALMFNILRGYMTRDNVKHTLFPGQPGHPKEFEDQFIDYTAKKMKDKDVFKRRILGLTSYYFGGEGNVFPDVIMRNVIESPFTSHHFSRYLPIRLDEIALEEKARKSKAIARQKIMGDFDQDKHEDITATFRVFSRQFSNYSFPDPLVRPLTSQWSNIIRPRLSSDPNEWTVGQITDLKAIFDGNLAKYEQFVKEYKELTTQVDRHNLIVSTVLSEGKTDTEYTNVTGTEEQFFAETLEMPKDYESAVRQSFDLLKQNAALNFRENLYILSPKMEAMFRIVNCEEPQGSCFIYSQFRTLEGINIFAQVLIAHGYERLNYANITEKNIDKVPKKNRFMIYTGEESHEQKTHIRNVFNNKANMRGEICKVLMGTAAAAEGITLRNVRQVHIMEPYWNEVRIQQVIGRARRICSHADLPVDERNIHVFRYHMTLTEEQQGEIGEELSTDQAIYSIAKRKKEINEQFLQILKDTSVDAQLNLKHNRTENNPITPFSFGKGEVLMTAFEPNISAEKSDVETSINYALVKTQIAVEEDFVAINGRLAKREAVSTAPSGSVIDELVYKFTNETGKDVRLKEIIRVGNKFDIEAEVYYRKKLADVGIFDPVWAIATKNQRQYSSKNFVVLQ